MSYDKYPLGTLRRNATRMHAVCRYHPGPRGGSKDIKDVREIALHPVAIEDDWHDYAQFLMYHEMLHAIGHVRHDRLFRGLEARWPNQNARESALPLANIYVKKLLDGCGLVHIANENIIAPVEATEDIYAEYVE